MIQNINFKISFILLICLFTKLNGRSQDTLNVYLFGDLEDGSYVGLKYQNKPIGKFYNSKYGPEYPLHIAINSDSTSEFQILEIDLLYTSGKSKRLKPLPIIFIYDPERTTIMVLTKPEKKKAPWFQTLYFPDIKHAPFYW